MEESQLPHFKNLFRHRIFYLREEEGVFLPHFSPHFSLVLFPKTHLLLLLGGPVQILYQSASICLVLIGDPSHLLSSGYLSQFLFLGFCPIFPPLFVFLGILVSICRIQEMLARFHFVYGDQNYF